jgi:outer membrane protein OmpA-like peptidoglycan-associated protein
MLKRNLLIFFLLIAARVLGTPGQNFILSWDIPEKVRVEGVRTAAVEFRVNNRLQRLYHERNIIDLTCYEKSEKGNSVRGRFKVFEKEKSERVFHLREVYNADFLIQKNGQYRVRPADYMPNLRHIPAFPSGQVAIGSRWTQKGALVINTFSVPFKLVFDVDYKLVSTYEEKGETVAVINFQFTFDKKMTEPGLPSDFPLRIVGGDEGTIYWNIHKRRPMDMSEKYKIVFLTRSGTGGVGSYAFFMKIVTRFSYYDVVTEKEKKEESEELKKELPEDDDINVDTDERGLVLRLGDVLFDFDSAELKPDARKKLDSILDIIRKKYPDREIIVEGHTDSTGRPEYNRKLSRERARSVARQLHRGLDHDKLSYRGYGEKKPLESNETREGRKKNRRVEIIIKMN